MKTHKKNGQEHLVEVDQLYSNKNLELLNEDFLVFQTNIAVTSLHDYCPQSSQNETRVSQRKPN